ncbi:hypothetical protein DL766_001676 [Monosporascus sp. MC13-8B]|uniref:Uncharacterized protein n=1 Tax=Monosporascus cannonballus TaxID=155416 RepID=A0ABY0H4U4_9PEZI|nr:hypothetical protein DL762_005443 [Monosporascus cannonballus]RYO91901.1 hypothetical protein DL763_004839 [Monosporascus cannonballus]RYP37102.1 hypothetical protein DL766_001676 [Monosporascus sp. MC13-8B]
MGQKREGTPRVRQENSPKRIKSEKVEDTKFDLRSIPPAPATGFKVKDEAESKPKFNTTGPTKHDSAQPPVTAILAPMPGLPHLPSLLFQAGPGGFDLKYTGTDTLPSGATIKVDEKDE